MCAIASILIHQFFNLHKLVRCRVTESDIFSELVVGVVDANDINAILDILSQTCVCGNIIMDNELISQF